MNSRTIGECIYCGKKNDLTKEHIVPKSFGGVTTLVDASCKSCAKITSKFEAFLLQTPKSGEAGMLYGLRVLAKMPSRRKSLENIQLKQFKQNINTGETTEELVNPENYVGVVMLPIFPEPDSITGHSHPNGIELDDIEWQTYYTNQSQMLPEFQYGSRFRSREGDFPRLLAKIAYGIAVLTFGLDKVKNSPLKKVILENSPDQSKWIGCTTNNTILTPGLAVWATELGYYKGRLSVKIKFIPEFPDVTPEYVVIVDPGVPHNR